MDELRDSLGEKGLGFFPDRRAGPAGNWQGLATDETRGGLRFSFVESTESWTSLSPRRHLCDGSSCSNLVSDSKARRSGQGEGYLRGPEPPRRPPLRRDGPRLRLRCHHEERTSTPFARLALGELTLFSQGIPNKGKLLTQLSLFFFDFLANAPETKHIPNHVITAKLEEMPEEVQQYKDQLEGRSIWVRRAQVLPVEAIVRGYITGASVVWDCGVIRHMEGIADETRWGEQDPHGPST